MPILFESCDNITLRDINVLATISLFTWLIGSIVSEAVSEATVL